MEDNRAFEYYGRFDDYLKGELDEEERQKLEEELSADSELQQEFDLFKMSVDIVHVSSINRAVKEAHDRFLDSNPGSGTQNSTSVVTWSLRIAAGLLVVMVSYGLLQFSFVSSTGLYESLYTAWQLPVTRGAQLTYTHLDSLYLHHNYDKVIMQYESLEERSLRDYFIAAMAAMELNDYERAIRLFQLLKQENEKTDTRLFEDETDYYMALSHLKNGDYQQALFIFQKIREDHSHLL